MQPKITFGMIVLNGEPFVRYNLRSIYPWAHQIIIVEGACRTSKASATPDGHSRDDTLQTVRRFQAEEDPEHKVVVVSAKEEGYEDGFWPEKTEMCQAFARRATGNYLWQVDSDEFYLEKDMPVILDWLTRGTGMISFQQVMFWGGIHHVTNGIYLAEFGKSGVPRIFAWGKGYRYAGHRPATVLDASGQNVGSGGSISSTQMRKRGVYMYHYSLVFPSQVGTKVSYYSTNSKEKEDLKDGAYIPSTKEWHNTNFKEISQPYRMSLLPYVAWIRAYKGQHPKQVPAMIADIHSGRVKHELRRTDDLEKLMRSRLYRLATTLLDCYVALGTTEIGYPFFRICNSAAIRFRRLFNPNYVSVCGNAPRKVRLSNLCGEVIHLFRRKE